ncbi:MAG TPA: SgcJ/EcaC family oxidoreductase [Candidatus Acidoferrales bacterium]
MPTDDRHDKERDKQHDREKIRELVAAWQQASMAGDIARILPLMAEDVVFMVCGHPPMRGRDAFAQAFGAMKDVRMEAHSEIQEIEVSGDLGYCWNHISVTVTPPGGSAVRRSGFALSVLRKQPDGNWVIIRDANLMAAEPLSGRETALSR